MTVAGFFRQFFGEPSVDEFVIIDESGRARFDVARYLSTKEGKQRVQDIASSIQESAGPTSKRATPAL